VLATYDSGGSGSLASEIELNAVYFYCRSILIAQPFQTGVDNLKVIFDKNARSSARLAVERGGGKRTGAGGGGGSSSAALTRILPQFVQLHGALFSLAMKEACLGEVIASAVSAGAEPALTSPHGHVSSGDEFQYSLGATPPPQSAVVQAATAHAAAVANTNSFVCSLMPEILEDLDILLSNPQSGLSPELLLRIVTICMFSVHASSCESQRRNAVNVDSTMEGFSSPQRIAQGMSRKRNVRTSAESLALIFLFSLINK
jgi:hypothetical protein